MIEGSIIEDISLLYNKPIPSHPIGIIKRLLRFSRFFESISFSYHIAPAFVLDNNGLRRSFISDKGTLSHNYKNPDFATVVKLAHDSVIASGTPTTYLELYERSKTHKFPPNLQNDPQKTVNNLGSKIKQLGIVDEYIIPVYGPYKIEGCMCFGYNRSVEELDEILLSELRKLALISHNKLVTYYQSRVAKVHLSKREIEVLRWMSLGKSKYDIAIISGLKPPTIETYIRRIYKKFNVNSKLGAVLAAISTNNLKM